MTDCHHDSPRCQISRRLGELVREFQGKGYSQEQLADVFRALARWLDAEAAKDGAHRD
jgi:hypothetical protein